MKHLDVIDGELAAVPIGQRPTHCMVGQHLAIIILQMRLQDAETWAAYTATLPTLLLAKTTFRDYILHANGLALRTPCECNFREEHISYADEQLLAQLDKEQIGYTDMSLSVIHIAKVCVQKSCSDLAQYVSIM